MDMPSREEAERLYRTNMTVETNLLMWIAVHGNLCLALRHPQNIGAARPHVVKFVKDLGKMLVEHKAVTKEYLVKAHRLEVEEGSEDLSL